jgi:hypothetical protein
MPHYWIVDIEPRTTLTACHRPGEFGYVEVRLELDQLPGELTLQPIPVRTRTRGSVRSSIAARTPSRPVPESFVPP